MSPQRQFLQANLSADGRWECPGSPVVEHWLNQSFPASLRAPVAGNSGPAHAPRKGWRPAQRLLLAALLLSTVCFLGYQTGRAVEQEPTPVPDIPVPVRFGSPRTVVTFDPDASNAYTGSAPFLFQPTFNDKHSVGVFVRPTLGPLMYRGQNNTAYNLALGTQSTPIPSGTKGMFSGYEANIFTDQQPSDLQPMESNHAFGCTIGTSGGAMMDVVDAVVRIKDKPATTFGVNVNVENHVEGGYQRAFMAQSTGPVPAEVGLCVFGNWKHGIDLQGHTLHASGPIDFATPKGAPTGYAIDGSFPDALRIRGGGTAGGMIIYGASGPGKSGLIRFRNNPVDNKETLVIDTATGNIYVSGNIYTPDRPPP